MKWLNMKALLSLNSFHKSDDVAVVKCITGFDFDAWLLAWHSSVGLCETLLCSNEWARLRKWHPGSLGADPRR